MRRTHRNIPAPVTVLARRLEAYRSKPRRRRNLPEELWREAARLAAEHGVCRVPQVLQLNRDPAYTADADLAGRRTGGFPQGDRWPGEVKQGGAFHRPVFWSTDRIQKPAGARLESAGL